MFLKQNYVYQSPIPSYVSLHEKQRASISILLIIILII